jgi:hypothetical protein
VDSVACGLLADCDFNRAALHPADPIKCQFEHVENADTRGAEIAQNEPLPIDSLENAIGQNRKPPSTDVSFR